MWKIHLLWRFQLDYFSKVVCQLFVFWVLVCWNMIGLLIKNRSWISIIFIKITIIAYRLELEKRSIRISCNIRVTSGKYSYELNFTVTQKKNFIIHNYKNTRISYNINYVWRVISIPTNNNLQRVKVLPKEFHREIVNLHKHSQSNHRRIEICNESSKGTRVNRWRFARRRLVQGNFINKFTGNTIAVTFALCGVVTALARLQLPGFLLNGPINCCE